MGFGYKMAGKYFGLLPMFSHVVPHDFHQPGFAMDPKPPSIRV